MGSWRRSCQVTEGSLSRVGYNAYRPPESEQDDRTDSLIDVDEAGGDDGGADVEETHDDAERLTA